MPYGECTMNTSIRDNVPSERIRLFGIGSNLVAHAKSPAGTARGVFSCSHGCATSHGVETCPAEQMMLLDLPLSNSTDCT